MSPLNLTHRQRSIIDTPALLEADRLADEIDKLNCKAHEDIWRCVNLLRAVIVRNFAGDMPTPLGGVFIRKALHDLLDAKESAMSRAVK
jgi:hypothetical protein